MTVKEAIDRLEPEKWSKTSIEDKLEFLKQIRKNLGELMYELGKLDIEMRNNIIGDEIYPLEVGVGMTVFPVGGRISACIELYESLMKGKMLEPISIEKVKDNLYDIHVFPQTKKDKMMYADRRDYLRVKGEPKQINPMDKPSGIIGILGAGNYSSSIEMINALFLENCAVVHKPHHLNEETDKVWERIMQPLIDYGALSFVSPKGGRDLVSDSRLTKIYFTGGTKTAQTIMSNTDTPLISECGGNNPCIIVPGDKPWTEKQIKHQAMQIATISKLNGGAVCGRIQTIITSKHWTQREEFLEALTNALENDTPAAGSYYPGTDEVFKEFQKNHPEGVVLKSEGGKYKRSEYLFIKDVPVDSFAVKNEAFCQIMSEVGLDTPANADDFLPKAVEFCNTKLLGTLGSAIIIDDDTLKNHASALKQAVTDLEYGGIGVNTMPPLVWMNPYLTWSGNEEGKEFVSGIGNFGNLLNFENVEKSIIYSKFMSPGHMIWDNKKTFNELQEHMARFVVKPSWSRMMGMMGVMIKGKLRHKDF